MIARSVRLIPPLLIICLGLVAALPATGADEDDTTVRASAGVLPSHYGETGRLSIRLTFVTEKALPERYRVVLHVASPVDGATLVEADHVPPVATTLWKPGEPVSWTVAVVVPPREDRSRPAAVVLVGLADPTVPNAWAGRLVLRGEEPFGDRRYRVGRVEAAKGAATVEELRAAARERAAGGDTAAAFHLLSEAIAVAATLGEKLAVTQDLLALPPPDGLPVTGPEQVFLDRLVAAEKLRWLRDRASDLLGAKQLKLALRVMEKIGGVAEEESNTKVVGEPNASSRAKKDVVDVKSRLLRDLDNEALKEARKISEKAAGDPKKLLAAAKKEIKRRRLLIGRRLLFEIRIDMTISEKLRTEVNELLEKIEHRICYELSKEEERTLAGETDHPSFARIGAVPTSRFIFLGPEGLVRAIPRASTWKLDVAAVLMCDLFGRTPVRPGERIVVYFKETYSGPATGGGRLISVGDADPADESTRVDTGLYYHELTHCVDDTRPVHDYKRGLTEGIANVGSIYVRDMFAGPTGRFEALSRAGRDAFRKHHLERENAYWLIPAYAPSEGFLTEILIRHAPAENDHVDWTKLGRVFRTYRESRTKSPRTHRLMAHLGHAMATHLGEGVWETLRSFGFPVHGGLTKEIGDLGTQEFWLRNLANRRDVDGLIRLADGAGDSFLADRARYAALGALGAKKQGDGGKARALRKRLGVVDAFHVIGPFYGDPGPGLAAMFPPSREIDFAKEYVAAQGVARWVVPKSGAAHYARMDARGVVVLRYGYPAQAVTFAVAHVTVPARTSGLAFLGADDEVALWINGRAVQRNHGRRMLVPDWERWPVVLEEGRNRVVVKLANQYGRTGFCLRFVDRDGRPIEGMETDLEAPGPLPAAVSGPDSGADSGPDWSTAFRDVYQRRSLGRKYEVVAGKFRIRNKVLSGEEAGRRPGWRPFSVRPGFPQDRPAALAWIAGGGEPRPKDFRWRVHLPEARVPKLVLTWDGEGNELPLSGWSLILVPDKKGENVTVRLERYDYLHYVRRVPVPEKWDEARIEVTRVADRVTVTVGGHPVLEGVSAPPLSRSRFGFAVWNAKAGLTAMSIAHPK
ncbi:MAG: hypothetical protein ABFS86_08470 [Planctomycetota bacterium]